MAPRKGKTQGKRNNIKIKSKVNTQKRGLRPMKKSKAGEKPLDSLKWMNKLAPGEVVKHCEAMPNWMNKRGVYKHGMASCSPRTNYKKYHNYPQAKEGENKSTTSDGSDECNCVHSKYSANNKCGILKRDISSNSLVAKYIKSGMDHVASFIVESAIRFGEQHGVVVPDKSTPNVYEITPPDNRYDEKYRKIRFKIPDKPLGYDEAKRVMWRSHIKNAENARKVQSPGGFQQNRARTFHNSTSSWETATDSIEEILPLLEKLKEGGGGIVSSELDLDKLARGSENDEQVRDRERIREKFRTFGKRYKSVAAMPHKDSVEQNYPIPSQTPWRRFRRDSVELGRKRLRASTCPRKPESMSPSPY